MYRPTNEQLARVVLSDSDRIWEADINTRHRRTVWSHLPEIIHGAVEVVPPFFANKSESVYDLRRSCTTKGSVTSKIWCGGPIIDDCQRIR